MKNRGTITVNARRNRRAYLKRKFKSLSKPPRVYDPTRSVTLRMNFLRALRAGFARLRLEVVRLVDDKDAFGLKDKSQPGRFLPHDQYGKVRGAERLGREVLPAVDGYAGVANAAEGEEKRDECEKGQIEVETGCTPKGDNNKGKKPAPKKPELTKVKKAIAAARKASGKSFATIDEVRQHLKPLVEGELTDERLAKMIEAHERDHRIQAEIHHPKYGRGLRYRGKNIGLIRILPKEDEPTGNAEGEGTCKPGQRADLTDCTPKTGVTSSKVPFKIDRDAFNKVRGIWITGQRLERTVKLSDLIATQGKVMPGRSYREGHDPIEVVEDNGKLYIHDGHNRASAAYAAGKTHINAIVAKDWPKEGTTNALDQQGGEAPAISADMLHRADFVTFSQEVMEDGGTNCGNCLHNEGGVCQFVDEGKGIDLRGQPVNDHNCCSEWDAEGTLRAWQDTRNVRVVNEECRSGQRSDLTGCQPATQDPHSIFGKTQEYTTSSLSTALSPESKDVQLEGTGATEAKLYVAEEKGQGFVKKWAGKVNGLVSKVPVLWKVKDAVGKVMETVHKKLAQRYGDRAAGIIMASGSVGGYGVMALAIKTVGFTIPFVTDAISIAGHVAAAEAMYQLGILKGKRPTANAVWWVRDFWAFEDGTRVLLSRPPTLNADDDHTIILSDEEVDSLAADAWEEVVQEFRRALTEHKAPLETGLGGERLALIDLATDHGPATNTRFAAETNPRKVERFRAWLRDKIDSTLAGDKLITDYINRSYTKGQGRAFDDAKKVAKGKQATDMSGADSRDQYLRSRGYHAPTASKVKLLAGRTLSELEGVSSQMATRMSRALADGLMTGKTAKQIGQDLATEVNVSQSRADAIAHTELVRAHAEGQLDAFEDLGVSTVEATVEWDTADDGKVCSLCRPLEGVVLTIAEARGLIPRHPRCRCAWSPGGIVGRGRTRTQARDANKYIGQSVRAETGARSNKQARKDSTWQGADVTANLSPVEEMMSSVEPELVAGFEATLAEFLINAAKTAPGSLKGRPCGPGQSAKRTGCMPKSQGKTGGGKSKASETKSKVASGGKGKAKPTKPTKPVKLTADEVHKGIAALLSSGKRLTASHVGKIAAALTQLTVKDIQSIKAKLGVKASGAKAELAKKVAEEAVAAVKSKGKTSGPSYEEKGKESKGKTADKSKTKGVGDKTKGKNKATKGQKKTDVPEKEKTKKPEDIDIGQGHLLTSSGLRELIRGVDSMEATERLQNVLKQRGTEIGPYMTHGMNTPEDHSAVHLNGMRVTYHPDLSRQVAASLYGLLSGNMPDALVNNTHTLTFTKQRNKDDIHWERMYGMSNFVSGATGGQGSTCVYNGHVASFKTLAHESGHNLASEVYGSTRPNDNASTSPEGKAYYTAQQKEKPVSSYGAKSPAEDFAEASMMYADDFEQEARAALKDQSLADEEWVKQINKYGEGMVGTKQWFRKNFPEKFKAMDAIMKKHGEAIETAELA